MRAEWDDEETYRWWHRRGAFAYVVILVVMLGATVITQSFDGGVAAVLSVAVVVPLVVAALWRRAVSTPLRVSLLCWPLYACATLMLLSRPAVEASMLLVGVIVLSFLFVGLTQVRGVGSVAIPFGVLVFLESSDLTLQEAAVRLPISMVVWWVVSELPARLLDQLRTKESELRRLADTDALTGLRNRNDLAAVLERLDAGAAVALIDLDHFKRFNDEHGHLAGDQALVDFGRLLAAECRVGDQAFRYGGEEFLMVLPRTAVPDAVAVVERVAASWAQRPGGPTISAGVVVGGVEAVARADALLYEAKRSGRDRVLTEGSVDRELRGA